MAVCSCGHCFTWEKFHMDGHRTGVVSATADNVPQAMGTVADGVYKAPNGREFSEGSIVAVATDMLDVQPRMAELKQVVAYAPSGMISHRPESELSNFIVDRAMAMTGEVCKRNIDVGILNFGGVRTDIPQGDVTKDDFVSMLPFNNYLSYVALKGSDLMEIFKFLGRHVQIIGGAEMTVEGDRLKDVTVGGQPVDPERIYGVATIDFLLDGGDSLFVAKNANELIITDKLLRDAVLPYVISLKEEGKDLSYHTDGRVKILGN